MCESTAYTINGEVIMQDVISVKIKGDTIFLADILNKRKQLNGRIKEIDLDQHGIYIELIK
ncbi:MAG: CooT family nickel-binding protein [Methanobacterium sp.]|jgi:predicted RNA-binding protein|nr:CooT family nickel-binding protein [Methanobacterium sp.]